MRSGSVGRFMVSDGSVRRGSMNRVKKRVINRVMNRCLCVSFVRGVVLASVVCTTPMAFSQESAEAISAPDIAEYLVRDTLLDLGLRDAPTPADYELAANLLSLAYEIDPSNAEIARSIVEAAWLGGDGEMMLAATRQVIRDDPGDTVAQLRLVSSIINEQQTVEGRLALYERFLGDRGKSLDPSVRSRLALDAALLERETGNVRGFIERLHLATTLDVSNKAAASLAAQFYSNTGSDPVSQLDYQFKLLLADPLDANVHMSIVRLLAKEGDYESAKRFLDNAITLFELESNRTPKAIEQVRIALDWQIYGAQHILDDLDPVLADRRAEAQSRIDSYIEAELPTDDLIKPEDFRYDIGIDRMRLLAAYNLGNGEEVADILHDIDQTTNDQVVALSEVYRQRGANQSAVISQMVSLVLDFQIMRAIVGLEPEKIREDVKEMVDAAPSLGPYFKIIEPLALFAEGKYEESLEYADEFPGSTLIDLIRAMSYEHLGEPELAVPLYAKIKRENAVDAYGAFARSKLVALSKEDQVVTSAGRQMIQIVKTIPTWIDQMIIRPSSFMYLDMVAPGPVVEAMETPMVKIRLKNLAPIPLALGASQPLNSQMLVLPVIDDRAKGIQGQVRPKVVAMDHRLRLRPLEELIIEVPADSPQTQWLLSLQSSYSITQRWRLLQGFRPRASDELLSKVDVPSDASVYGIINSPLGLTTESSVIQRLNLEEMNATVDELIELLSSDDEMARHRAIRACAGRLTLPTDEGKIVGDDLERLIGSLVDLYTRAGSRERARMILLLPQRHQLSEMITFDDHVVSSILSDALIDSRVDPVVLAAALLTRAEAEDSPIFEVLDQTDDPRLHTIAKIIQARLATFQPTYSMVGVGVDSMLPKKEGFGF